MHTMEYYLANERCIDADGLKVYFQLDLIHAYTVDSENDS